MHLVCKWCKLFIISWSDLVSIQASVTLPWPDTWGLTFGQVWLEFFQQTSGVLCILPGTVPRNLCVPHHVGCFPVHVIIRVNKRYVGQCWCFRFISIFMELKNALRNFYLRGMCHTLLASSLMLLYLSTRPPEKVSRTGVCGCSGGEGCCPFPPLVFNTPLPPNLKKRL